MLRARVAKADCTGDTRVKIPRSRADKYSGARALCRKRNRESNMATAIITISLIFFL
jgi:hypothetical protein